MTNRLFRRCNLLLFKICIHQTDQIKQDSNIKETVNNSNHNSMIMDAKEQLLHAIVTFNN